MRCSCEVAPESKHKQSDGSGGGGGDLVVYSIIPQLSEGRPKCALGRLQKLMHVPLAIAILLVANLYSIVFFQFFHYPFLG